MESPSELYSKTLSAHTHTYTHNNICGAIAQQQNLHTTEQDVKYTL